MWFMQDDKPQIGGGKQMMDDLREAVGGHDGTPDPTEIIAALNAHAINVTIRPVLPEYHGTLGGQEVELHRLASYGRGRPFLYTVYGPNWRACLLHAADTVVRADDPEELNQTHHIIR